MPVGYSAKIAPKMRGRKDTARTRRLNLRATAGQANLIRTGAESRGLSVTDFVLESACQQAEQTLADQRDFVLSSKQWRAFVKALDQPARVSPGLARLFTEPSALGSRPRTAK